MPLSYFVPWGETLTFSGSFSLFTNEEVGFDIPKVTYIVKVIFFIIDGLHSPSSESQQFPASHVSHPDSKVISLKWV